MKLRKVTCNDPVERMSVSVRHSTTAAIDSYRAYYQKCYGDAIERSQVVEEMLLNFMAADKDFAKFNEKKAASKATTPPTGAQGELKEPDASEFGLP